MKYIYRCIDCQLTVTAEPDRKAPARTLGWLMQPRCPVCTTPLEREGERAPRERREVRAVPPIVHVIAATVIRDTRVLEPRASYEAPAIESTEVLSPVAAAIAAASMLTPEEVEERRAIGARREPQRSAAFAKFMKRSAEYASALCAACKHTRSQHSNPDCELCDCERFEAVQ